MPELSTKICFGSVDQIQTPKTLRRHQNKSESFWDYEGAKINQESITKGEK